MGMNERRVPFQVIFKCKILSDKDSLPVLFDHVEIIRWIHFALEQDPLAVSVVLSTSNVKSARVDGVSEEFSDQGGRALEGDGLAIGLLCRHCLLLRVQGQEAIPTRAS